MVRVCLKESCIRNYCVLLVGGTLTDVSHPHLPPMLKDNRQGPEQQQQHTHHCNQAPVRFITHGLRNTAASLRGGIGGYSHDFISQEPKENSTERGTTSTSAAAAMKRPRTAGWLQAEYRYKPKSANRGTFGVSDQRRLLHYDARIPGGRCRQNNVQETATLHFCPVLSLEPGQKGSGFGTAPSYYTRREHAAPTQDQKKGILVQRPLLSFGSIIRYVCFTCFSLRERTPAWVNSNRGKSIQFKTCLSPTRLPARLR